jgi:hypothetical protein
LGHCARSARQTRIAINHSQQRRAEIAGGKLAHRVNVGLLNLPSSYLQVEHYHGVP